MAPVAKKLNKKSKARFSNGLHDRAFSVRLLNQSRINGINGLFSRSKHRITKYIFYYKICEKKK